MRHLKSHTFTGEEVLQLFLKEHGLSEDSVISIETVGNAFGIHRLDFTVDDDKYIVPIDEFRKLLARAKDIAAWRVDNVTFLSRNNRVTVVEMEWTPRPLRWYEKLFRKN